MINIFLDDLRPAPEGFVLARTAEEAIRLLKMEKVDTLSLDFDLGWDRPTGFAVARFMAETGRYPRHIVLHTANPFGRRLMYGLLARSKPKKVSLEIRPIYPWW